MSLCQPVDSPLIAILWIIPKIYGRVELGYHLLVPIMLETHNVLDVPVLTHLSHLITDFMTQVCHMCPINPLGL